VPALDGYHRLMTLLKALSIPAAVLVVGVVYWFLSYEPAGTALLVIFALAIGVFTWVLVPTFGDVGPTAPVDADWHERKSA
jgi:hypothetical protein